MTIRLLEKTPGHHLDRTDAVEAISKKIDHMTSNLVRVKPSGARLTDLEQIVEAAAILAVDIGKQRGLFKFEQPSGYSFNANTMEEVSTSDNDTLEGKMIRSVIFPTVTKWGSESGLGYERSITIFKAQVLV